MKKFLITTALSIATTAAFGAASLRAPQIGGTATVTTPAATTNVARAGTMRAQTMKTSSVSTPTSVTTTQSIATPVSTETTDARIALLKGIKGFNPGKIKDTATAQQELNAIDSRIEELQTQLDRAEAAQSSVITEANIDAKIEEKLTELGASTSAKDTYSKTEINALLSALEKKLPQIDDRGNINIPTSNEQDKIRLLPYYLYATHTHAMLGHSMTYKLYTPHDFGTTNWQSLAQEYTSGWVNDICSEYQSNPDLLSCGFWVANGTSTAMTEFLVSRCDKGFYLFYTTNVGGVQTSKYATYENKTETQIREYFCGTLPSDLCWISNFQTKSSMGNCTPKIFYVNINGEVPDYYFNYIGGDHGVAMGGNALTYMQHFATNAPLGSNAIDDFVDSYCGDREPFWCAKNRVIDRPSGFDDLVNIKERFHGYVLRSIEMSSVGTYSTYNTNEDEPATYINSNVCGNPNGTTSCYVVNVDDMSLNNPYLLDPTSINVDDRYIVTVFKATTPETELPAQY